MNSWNEVGERFRIKSERFEAAKLMSDGRIGARANRGRILSQDKVDALIWGLRHESPVVRRCCLEFLDQHPSTDAIPHIVNCLVDPVPRGRWHAVHALTCDACKPGVSYLSSEVLDRLRAMSDEDTSPKVRSQATWALISANEFGDELLGPRADGAVDRAFNHAERGPGLKTQNR